MIFYLFTFLVKPGTPVETRNQWEAHESPSSSVPQSPIPTVSLPSIQQISPQQGGLVNLFKTPQLPPNESPRQQDVFGPRGQLDPQVHHASVQQGGKPVYGPGHQQTGSESPVTPGSQSPASMYTTKPTTTPSTASRNLLTQASGDISQSPTGDRYTRPPGTPMAPTEDPYSHPPHTPRPQHAQDPYIRPPSTPRPLEEQQFVHSQQQAPAAMPRTPQEAFGGPRFPSPAPRLAVPFSAGQQRPPINMPQQQHQHMSVDPYSRPPMTPRGPLPHPSQRFPQQQPITSDPYGAHQQTSTQQQQQSPSAGSGSSLAEMHPEMQQMLVSPSQRMAGAPQAHPHTAMVSEFYRSVAGKVELLGS